MNNLDLTQSMRRMEQWLWKIREEQRETNKLLVQLVKNSMTLCAAGSVGIPRVSDPVELSPEGFTLERHFMRLKMEEAQKLAKVELAKQRAAQGVAARLAAEEEE